MTERRKTILVVEDEGDLRALIKARLSEDYDVIEAGDGNEGMKRAVDRMPDLILLDIRMPGGSGYEMLKTLRARNTWGANVPVIFLTNIEPHSDDEIDDLLALKPADYFIKSNTDLDEVAKKIGSILQ